MALRRWWLALIAVLLAGCAGVQNNGVNAVNPTTGPEEAVAKITYRDGSVEYISQATLDQFQNQFYPVLNQGAPPPPAEPVLNELITRRLLLRQARNNDVTADPQRVEQTIASIRTSPQFCGSLVQDPTIDPNNQEAYFNACAQALGFADGQGLRDYVAEELTVIKATEQFANKDMIRAAHILFNTEDYAKAEQTYQVLCGSAGPATQPQAVSCSSSADFNQLARDLSIDPSAKQSGGELPPFNEQGLAENQQQPFDATFVSNTVALKQQFLDTGVAISQPFQTQFGWHIVKIQELVASSTSQQDYRDAVLERARNAKIADLSQPDTGDVPLIGVAEVLVDFPPQPTIPTIEPVPEELQETPTPEATSSVPEEGTATPQETVTP